ncbi:hypothetical protein GN956_G22862 [Arapaima gigas]
MKLRTNAAVEGRGGSGPWVLPEEVGVQRRTSCCSRPQVHGRQKLRKKLVRGPRGAACGAPPKTNGVDAASGREVPEPPHAALEGAFCHRQRREGGSSSAARLCSHEGRIHTHGRPDRTQPEKISLLQGLQRIAVMLLLQCLVLLLDLYS